MVEDLVDAIGDVVVVGQLVLSFLDAGVVGVSGKWHLVVVDDEVCWFVADVEEELDWFNWLSSSL